MIYVFWSLFTTLGLGINELKLKGEDFRRRKNSADGLTYTDHNCRKRLLSNNHPCVERWNNGDKEIIDCKTMEVVWTTKFKRISKSLFRYKEDAISKGRTTFRCDTHNDKINHYEYGEVNGHIYEDFNTNDKYIIRKSCTDNCFFFVNIETKKAVRYTDYTIQFINDTIKNIEKQIKKDEKQFPNRINYWKQEKENWENIKNGSKLREWDKLHSFNQSFGKNESYGEKMEEEFSKK